MIESCVLGLASPEEQREFEQLQVKHPEVKAAREAFERSMEQHAVSNAVLPPANVKEKLLSELHISQEENNTAVVRSIKRARFLAVAAVALLVVSTGLNFYFYRQYNSSLAKYDALVFNMQETAKLNQTQQAKLELYELSMRMMGDSNMAIIDMKGRPLSPSSRTTVYWDKQTKDVWLQTNNLPQPTTDKQYQLWAIVDGKPVDAGVFDVKDAYSLVKLKNIPRAQAFAITLEKKGGSAAPTLEAMYVMGQV